MKILFTLGLLMASFSAFSAVQYFNGKIERIEVCKSNGGINLYFKDINGSTPAITNGCSNDIALPYVKLNDTIGSLTDFEKSILSTALTAQAAERSIRVRYDDQSMLIQSIAID